MQRDEQRASQTTPAPTQMARLRQFSATRCVDAHCHCLPGLDDGPANAGDALSLCKLLVSDGFTDVIATPHQLGRYDGLNFGPEVRAAVAQLQALLDRERVPLKLHAGGEVRVDERIVEMLECDRALSLAGGKYVLLELPTAAPVSAKSVAEVFRNSPQVQIILAHAERYESLRRDPRAAQEWLEIGAAIQLNAESLLDDASPGAQDLSLYWLSQGWVSLLATDAHNLNSRRPRMTEAIRLVEKQFGLKTAKLLCLTNPSRLLDRAG